jgi:hypothetical protein
MDLADEERTGEDTVVSNTTDPYSRSYAVVVALQRKTQQICNSEQEAKVTAGLHNTTQQVVLSR